MRIERLSADEGPRLRAIRLRSLTESPEAFSSTLAESEARPGAVWARQVRELATFVAVVDDRDSGLVRGIASDEDPATAMLLSMWVAPEVRRRGVGRALVTELVGWAQREGFTRVSLDVADANPRAIALYASMGFEPAGSPPYDPVPGVPEHRRTRELVEP